MTVFLWTGWGARDLSDWLFLRISIYRSRFLQRISFYRGKGWLSGSRAWWPSAWSSIYFCRWGSSCMWSGLSVYWGLWPPDPTVAYFRWFAVAIAATVASLEAIAFLGPEIVWALPPFAAHRWPWTPYRFTVFPCFLGRTFHRPCQSILDSWWRS